MERCLVLSAFSEEPERLTRPFASGAMRNAQQSVTGWMQQAGMSVHRDNIGNLRGRYAGAVPAVPPLLVGSHLDTVRGAGKYDGPLGVMVAIAAVQRLHDRRTRLPFAIEVIGFADEEGLRYGSTYLGSRALSGSFDLADLERVDAAGIRMADAIRSFGGDPHHVADDAWRGGRPLGYCEVHIEQGTVLESRDLPVGVVSAISGQMRQQVTFTGEAGHAGTVPMSRRRDALGAAAEFILAVEADARAHDGVVATVGQLTVHPGAANVVPGEATMSLDVRHPDDAVRTERCRWMLRRARAIAKKRHVDVALHLIVENKTVPCAPRLTTLLAQAIADTGRPALDLPSGAGHDVVPLSAIADVAMLFVRCKGGVSHNPAESVTTADVAVAIDVLDRFLDLLAQT
jgi:allantoate deiminase